VLGAPPTGRERRQRRRVTPGQGEPTTDAVDTTSIAPAGPKPVLTHPPRPRKQKRR